ncbi:class I SAM-dependent methyltransferase [Nocardia carnea]|uniref:class I SAM-dependent methyltransferase n=1 Tax=Nocardia carnea TaxID=37328 RepID=UPI0024575FDB|nr:class I SAM-dependent methyltransferase [Nocardia carnea]
MIGRFDPALTGGACWVRTADGDRVPLPTSRWLGGDRATAADIRVDSALVSCCDGPTVDLGCGPGRLVAALCRRGVMALGVDISPTAIAVTRHRGAPAVPRDVFGPLPGDGRWHYALLADGNIGIGGDPHRLLRRVARLLRPDGVAVVEFAAPGTGIRIQEIRLETHARTGDWFPWAEAAIDHAGALAAETGFELLGTAGISGRHLAWLRGPAET